MSDWFKFLPEREYQETFETPRFEEEVESSQSIIERAFDQYRQAAELREQMTWEPDPRDQFRQVEQQLQPLSAEQRAADVAQFEREVPAAEQLVSGMTAGAERLQERAQTLGIERLAAEREETPYERRRSLGQVPAQARAGFAYEPETEAATARLVGNLRESHPDWSEEQVFKAATGIMEPGEGFMEAAAWGLAMRPALAAMAARAGESAAPAGRAAVAEFERAIPKARDFGRRLVTEEAGGLKPKPKYVLVNDIRTPMEITKKLNQLEKLPRLSKAQKAERIRLYAEKDLNELRATGDVESQMDNLLADIKEMGEELELRAVSREYKPTQAPQFGTVERAEWEAARAGRPHGYRPTTQYANEPREVLEGRLKVYQEFANNMKIDVAKPGEEHLVTRARFTEKGEVVEEPTFATEGELAGVKPVQAELGIGAGERPIETAGPMFEQEAAKFAEAVPSSAERMGQRAAVRGPTKAEALERWRTRLEGGEPPKEPPVKPPTAESAGGVPPETAGNRFVAPLREFDDVTKEVITSDNALVRALVGKTGINPSVLNDTPVGRALTAYWRQRVSGELLSEVAISPAVDVHAQMFTGRMGRVLRITPEGEITTIRSPKPGQSRMWQDVFSRPGDYTLPDELRAYIDDYLTVVRETEAMRVAAGLKPRAMRGEEGWFYVPRQVKEIRGVELRRPSNPGLQRIYEEAQEGAAAGVRYSDNPRATLELHVRSAYREVAEKQLADALEPLSITPKQLIPDPVRIRMENAVKARVGAERQLRSLNRDYLKAAGKGKPGWPKREAGLGEMRKGIQAQKATVETAKQTYWQAKKAYTRAMEAARKAEVAPGKLFGQAEETIPIASWRNRFFPREQADALNEALGSFLRPAQKASPFARGLEVTGNYIRFLSAVGDFAEPFIQGLPTLAYRPNVWAKSALRHYQAFFDPTVQARFMRQHLETFQKMAQHGAPIGDPEFFAALTREGGFSAGKLLEVLPKGAEARKLLQQGGKQTFGRFQASYNTGLASNRAYLYESLQPAWKGTEGELWQFIKNMTGGLDSRALGVGPSQRGFESVWLAFSPRLLRSTAALIGDAARPNTPQGQAALKALGGLAAFAAGTYVITGLALGKSWEEIGTGLNPTQGKKFLSHDINGDWIGVGGQVRAISQFMAHSISAIAPGGEPIESFASTSQFENPVLSFYSSRGAPAVNIVGGLVEAGTGLNALPFDQVDSGPALFKHLGTSALPFAVQGKLEGEQWATTGAALVGARTSPETVYEERNKTRDQAAQRMFGRDWADLLRGEQNEVREANPTVRELETEATELGVERDYDYSQRTQAYRERKDEMGDEGERALASDPTGREWASWRKTAGIKLNTTWEELTIRFGIEDEPREPEFIEDRLAERYWNLELDTNNDGLISNDEYRTYDTEREAILSEARAAAVDEEYILHGYRGQMWPNHPQLQAIEEEYQQAKEIAHEYYSIPAKVGMSAEEQDIAADLLKQAQSIASSSGMPFELAVRKVTDDERQQFLIRKYKVLPTNPARKRYWQQHPEEERLFKRFYSDIPLSYAQEPEPEFALAGAR